VRGQEQRASKSGWQLTASVLTAVIPPPPSSRPHPTTARATATRHIRPAPTAPRGISSGRLVPSAPPHLSLLARGSTQERRDIRYTPHSRFQSFKYPHHLRFHSFNQALLPIQESRIKP
jgi:hypothetical protein